MKNKLVINVFIFSLAVLIIAAGVIIPSILLNVQEQNMIGNRGIYDINNKELISAAKSEPIQIGPLKIDDILKRLNTWVYGGETIMREPHSNEVSMDLAAQEAIDVIEYAVRNNMLPEVNGDKQWQLTGAELFWSKTPPSSKTTDQFGVWSVHFHKDESDITVLLDSKTACILGFDLFTDVTNDIVSPESMLKGYVNYLKVQEGETVYLSDYSVMSIESLNVFAGVLSIDEIGSMQYRLVLGKESGKVFGE